jgi:hypothetical protein
MGEVITNTHFLKTMWEDARRALSAYGVVLCDPAEGGISELDLPPKAPGETVVGRLTVDEACILHGLVQGTKELDAANRAKLSLALSAAAKVAADPSVDLGAIQQDVDIQPDDAAVHYRTSQQNVMLHGLLHWMLGERLGLHDWRLGCRKGGVIVKIQRRW